MSIFIIYPHKQEKIIGVPYPLFCSNALFVSLLPSSPNEADELRATWPPTNGEFDSWTGEKPLPP